MIDHQAASSVEPAEVERFARMAETWWDAEGPFKPLHRLGPARLGYIRDSLVRHCNRPMNGDLSPLQGLRLLDMGCGGGLISEPLARMGARVTGADAAARNIAIACVHAAESGLDIDYRHATVEQLAAAGERFDAVLILEIVEHVADIGLFLRSCRQVLDKDGLLIFSTLNRTARSFIAAIVGAEYVLRWLPKGTHDWRKFITPTEMERHLSDAGFAISNIQGLNFQPLSGTWRLGHDLGINYIGTAIAQ